MKKEMTMTEKRFSFFADKRANAEKTKRAVFCQRSDRKTKFEMKI